MSELTRELLRGKFQTSLRPDGGDFASLIDSALNKESDGLSIDGDRNLVLGRGLRLGNSDGKAPGGLRFTDGQVQFNDGITWKPLSGAGGGVFATVGVNGEAAYKGLVGIGDFAAPAPPPTYRFEVNLAANSGVAEQVRFGNVVCSNGTGGSSTVARFSHRKHASNTNFAFQQSDTGAVQINAPEGQPISFSLGFIDVFAGITGSGKFIVGGDSESPSAPPDAIFQVLGKAWKRDNLKEWNITSDARVKDNVRNLEAGLAEIRRVRPVRYRLNGRAGTPAGLEGVGILGQEIEQVLPETVERVRMKGSGPDVFEDLRVFNGSALTFVLINAVKELAEKVDRLEGQLAHAKGGTVPQ